MSVCGVMFLSAMVKLTENESELVNQSAELRSESVPSNSPSSPLLFSADEEDVICSESSKIEDESAAENEAVSGFFLYVTRQLTIRA